MAGKKRHAGGKGAAAVASTRESVPAASTENPSGFDDGKCYLAVIISQLLDIASSQSRSKEVLQAFCDQKCPVDVLPASPDGGSSLATSISSPSSSLRSRKHATLLPHFDCYWIILATDAMNRLMVLKESQKKKKDKAGHIFACLVVLADAMSTILLHDKAKLEKASQNPSGSGSSRSILCRAILSTTVVCLYVVQNYDPTNQDHTTDKVENLLNTSVECLYRMVFLKPWTPNTMTTVESETSDVVKLAGSWSMNDLKIDCEQVEQVLGSSIKLSVACVECLLDTSVDTTEDAVGPPPAKRSARTRSGANKPSPIRKSPSTLHSVANLQELIQSFQELLNAKDFGVRIDGRTALKRWSSIAVVWSQGGSGQLDVLQAAHNLATIDIPPNIISPSQKSSLMYQLILVAAEVGSQCGARPTANSMDQYLKAISSSIDSSTSRRGKRSKTLQRSDVRDMAILVIYDFLQNHRKCLEEVAQSNSFCDVVDDGDGGIFLAPRFGQAITDLCDSASANASNSSYEEQTDCNMTMLTISVGFALRLIADPSLPLDCNLAIFALSHVSQCLRRIDSLSPGEGRESIVQDVSVADTSDDSSTVQIQEQLIRQYELDQPMPVPSVNVQRSSGSCTFATVLSKSGPFSSTKSDDLQAVCIILRAINKDSQFGSLIPFLIEVIRRVYDTRFPCVKALEEKGGNRGEIVSAKKRKAFTRSGEDSLSRKSSRRRKTDQGEMDIERNETIWQRISPSRASVAIEALGCLNICFTRTKLKDSSIFRLIRSSVSSADLQGILNLGGMLECVVIESHLEGASFEADDKACAGPIEDFSSYERTLWKAHMTMAKSNLGLSARNDQRTEIYKFISSTFNDDFGGNGVFSTHIPSASHAFLSTSMLNVFNEDSRNAESILAEAYVCSVAASLKKISRGEIQDLSGRSSTLRVPLSYDDARTLLLAVTLCGDKHSHLQVLVQGLQDCFQSSSFLQSESEIGFVTRVLVVCSWITSTIIGGKEMEEALRLEMGSFVPSLPVHSRRVKWHRRETSFLGIFDSWKSPALPFNATIQNSSLIPKKTLEDLHRVFESAFSTGFETASMDHGYLLFAAWNGLSRMPPSSPSGIASVPNLDASTSDSAKKILQMREDVFIINRAVGTERYSDSDTMTIPPSRLKVTLKRMIIQVRDTLDHLIASRPLDEEDEVRQKTSPAALALLAALPTYVSFIASCYTKAGGDVEFTASSRKQRGYSSESEPPASDGDSEIGSDDFGDLSRLKECCESFGGAPVHPDWLDKTCGLRDGICHAELLESVEIAMNSLTRLASFAFRQSERLKRRAIRESLRKSSACDERARFLALLPFDHARLRDTREDVAAIAHCPIEVVNALFDDSVNDGVREAREIWCPVSGSTIPGALQRGRWPMDSWGVTQAELRAAAEWELLFTEAITLACHGKLGKRNANRHDPSTFTEVITSKLWRQVLSTSISHLVPVAALVRLGVEESGRKPHPFSPSRNNLDIKSALPLHFSDPLSKKCRATPTLATSTTETLSLLALVKATGYRSVAPMCRAVATHIVCDTSSFDALESLCCIGIAFEALERILKLVEVAPKKGVKKVSISRVVEILVAAIGHNGISRPETECRNLTDTSETSNLIHRYLFTSSKRTVETIVERSVDVSCIFMSREWQDMFDSTSDSDRSKRAVKILVKLLCDDSFHASSRTMGFCAGYLSRAGSLEVRLAHNSLIGASKSSVLSTYIEAFNLVEKKHLKSIIQKGMTVPQNNPPFDEYGQELADLLSLLLVDREFKNAMYVMDLLLKSFDSWKEIPFRCKIHLVSLLITYGACFGKLVEVGSFLLEAPTRRDVKVKGPGHGEAELLSSFFLSLIQLQEKASSKSDSDGKEAQEASDGDTTAGLFSRGTKIPNSCTFIAKSGFHSQHWYNCFSCGLTDDRGCCTLCALVCHKGHDVIYSRSSSFFCDCAAENGSSGVPQKAPCKCLSALDAEEIKKLHERESMAFPEPRKESSYEQACLLGRLTPAEISNISFRHDSAKSLSQLANAIVDSDLGHHWLKVVFSRLQEEFRRWKDNQSSGIIGISNVTVVATTQRTPLAVLVKRLRLRQASARVPVKLENLDDRSMVPVFCATGFHAKYSADSATHTVAMARLSRSGISRNVMVCDSRGRAVIAEPNELVFFCPLATSARHTRGLRDQPVARTEMTIFGTAPIKFNVIGMRFSINERLLVVWGTSRASVLVLKSSFDGIDETKTVQLSFDLDGEDNVVKCEWLPGSQSNIALASSSCVRVYDISNVETKVIGSHNENRATLLCRYNLGLEARLCDIEIAGLPSRNTLVEASESRYIERVSKMYLLLENGRLHCLDIKTVNGKILSSEIRLDSSESSQGPTPVGKPSFAQVSSIRGLGEGSKLVFLRQSRLLLYECKSSAVMALLLDQKGQVEGSFELLPPRTILSNVLGVVRSFSGPYTHWTELGVVFRESGSFFRVACVGRCANQPHLVCFEFNETQTRIKELPFFYNSSSAAGHASLEGLTAFSSPIVDVSADNNRNWAGERVFLCAVTLNGNLLCFGDGALDLADTGGPSDKPLKFRALPLVDSGAQKPPITIFESLVNASEMEQLVISSNGLELTPGDLKERLGRDSTSTLICPREGCCIVFSLRSNSSETPSSLVLSAVRILLGSSSSDTLPRKVVVQGREIEVLTGGKRWHNIVLTEEEVARGVRMGCISVSISSAQDSSQRPVVDAIEVFASDAGSTIQKKYFAASEDYNPMFVTSAQEKSPFEHALDAATNLSEVLIACSPVINVSVDVKNIFWMVVEGSVIRSKANVLENLEKLGKLVEPDASERRRRFDECILLVCSGLLNEAASHMTEFISRSEDMSTEGSESVWASLCETVRGCIESAVEIGKERPINYLQGAGVIADTIKEGRSIAVSASDIIVQGRCYFPAFDDLTGKISELLMTETALNLLSDESTRHQSSASLNTLKEYIEAPKEDVVAECCSAICTFFNEHRTSVLKSGKIDMFQQLEAARFVSYKCDSCLVCPMQDVRYTIPEDDQWIDLCQECFDKGTRFAKKKSNPSLEVKIDGRTVGSERVLTCEDLKRLKPVPIEKLEVASTWDGEGPAMENGEELLAASGLTDDGAWRTAHKSSLEGLDMFLGRVFDFVLGRLASIFKDEGGDTYPAPLLSLLLELLNESKSPFYRVERAKSLARTISNEMSTLLDGHDTCSSMSRSVLTQLESLVKVLSNLSDSACGRSQPLDLSKKQPHNILCKVHGIPAVRRRCAKPGINRDRRFYVCGLPKGQRCDFFCWADSSECRQVEEQEMASPRERRSPSRDSMESSIGVIIRDSLWNTSTSSGPLHLRLCSLFEDEFGPSEFAENRTGFETFNQPRKTTRKHEFLKDCLYTMQIAKNEYNDGVWCSKEKLQGCVWLRVEGKKSVISDHAFNEITPPEAPVSDPRLIVFESVLDLITRIADHSTAQRWLSLLCDLAITPDSASPRDLAIKALKKFCRGDVILCQAIRDCHAFQFYLKRIISLAADSIALAVLAKEKARQCGSNWSGKAITLAELNAAALVGASVLISEDALTESNRKKIGKALDDLWAIAKKQGHHWRQFCGMSTLPQSFRQMAVSKGNDLREQAFHELLNTPPIVALLWMASCSTGTNQVKLLRLIDFAIYKNHQDQADLSLSDRIWPDHSESAGELKHPEQILVSSDRRMSSLDIVTMTTNLVYEGRSADLRRVAFSVISKLIKEWTLEDEKWAIFRLLFSFITDVGILGKAGVEFLSLLQTLARSLAPREEMRSMGYTAFKAFESQLGIISFNRCNGEWVTIESTTGSKTRRIDLSRCSFCCHQNLNSIRSSFSRTLTKKMRQESARVSTDGENSAKTLLTSNVNPKRKFHRDQVSPFSRHRLDMEKISSEFSLFFKLKYRIAISEIHIAISDPRGRYVKVVNVYCTPRPIQELSELKSDAYAAKWQKVATLRVTSRGLTRISARLMLPVVAANIKLEFAEFYERPGEGTKGADGSTLVLCPRCTNPVTNSHGVCGRCGDAVFQCRRCRHINYDRLDGFLCAECGYSNHMGSLSFEVTAGVASNAVAITNDNDYLKAKNMLGAAMTIEEELREALREKAGKMTKCEFFDIEESSFFDNEMQRAFLGLPPVVAIANDCAEPSSKSLLERFDGQGSVVKAIACPDTQKNEARPLSAADRSERTRSLLNLARQIRNSSESSSDLGSGINLDNLEEILETGNIFESTSAGEQPAAMENSNHREQDRKERSKKAELDDCQKLVSLLREAEKECMELRQRIDGWTALNNGSILIATAREDVGSFEAPDFLPSHCSCCSTAVACGILELWGSLLKVGPSHMHLDEGILRILLQEGEFVAQRGLVEAKKKAVVSIATTSEFGSRLVLKALRNQLVSAQDMFCADVLGKILQEKDFPRSDEFAKLAKEVLSSRTSNY